MEKIMVTERPRAGSLKVLEEERKERNLCVRLGGRQRV